MSELLSYARLLKDRDNFRKSGTKGGSDFNLYETPGNLYFRILFYFHNGDVDGGDRYDGGLLAPTWDENINNNYYEYGSAWSYLMMNAEERRADNLKYFVELLSNINSESPWYFSSISGISEALDRTGIHNNEGVKIQEERKRLSIKCLPDALDTRIGTLLDLYRDVVWDWINKKEIVPANLRKFDMGIYLFSDPIKSLHRATKDNAAVLNEGTTGYRTSCKYIEFHNCEIDYNSSKSAHGDLTNEDGLKPTYTIDIMYDDAYERRYNEFMIREMGDILEYDLINNIDDERARIELSERLDADGKGFIENALGEVIGAGKSIVMNKLNSIYLGNLYTVSPKTVLQQLKSASAGHVFSTANAVDDYLSIMNKKSNKTGNLGNLFKNKSTSKNI